jgi:hypothetical protein
MARRPRRNHPAVFKAKVALAAIRGEPAKKALPQVGAALPAPSEEPATEFAARRNLATLGQRFSRRRSAPIAGATT